jgi:growth factor-regulated tyrosine kinase substrate
MLEERLSKAYSQHNLGGYNLSNPRQPSSPYPTIGPAGNNSSSGAENFYTGEAPQNFVPPTTTHNYLQHTPQTQYTNYNKRSSVSIPSSNQYPPQQTLQRNDSYQKQAQSIPARYPNQPNFVSPEHGPTPSQPSHMSQPSPQTPHNQIREPVATPSVDSSAAYYYNSSLPADGRKPTRSLETAPSPYPNLHQASSFNRQSVPPTPASANIQPAQPPAQPSQAAQQYQQVPQPNAQHYWQQQQQNVSQPSHVYQAGAPGYAGFSQESFPSVPHHAPQQPVVEESLIDL